MKIHELGEVGVVMTEANEPVLSGGDQVIGFRELRWELFKGPGLARHPISPKSKGWAWQTRRRLLLLDHAWLDLPGGKKGKRFHEVPFEESIQVVHKKRRVLLLTEDAEHGKITFEFRPFGAAARLLAWLKNEKEHREMREEGTLRSPYREEDRRVQGPPG